MPDATPAPDRTTAEIRGWVVFAPGFWKGENYAPADVRRLGENYAYLRPHLTPVLKLGHDKQQQLQQRVKQSLGFPNVGRVEAAHALDDNRFVLDRIVGVPLDVAGWINAGWFNSGSVELKPAMPDPADPGKTIRGPILTAIALLGEEPPALQSGRLTKPVAVYPDGTPVPAATETGTLLAMMADVTRAAAGAPEPDPATFSLCFSDYTPEPPAVNADQIIAALASLTPEDKAKVAAACCANMASGPTATTTPPAAGTQPTGMSDADKGKKDEPPAYFAEFAAGFKKFADDMTGRVGSLEAANKTMSDAKADAEEKAFSDGWDATFERHDGPKKLAPQEAKALKESHLDLARTKQFAAGTAERAGLLDGLAARLKALPVNPMIEPAGAAPSGAGPLPAAVVRMARPGGVLDRLAPAAAEVLRN